MEMQQNLSSLIKFYLKKSRFLHVRHKNYLLFYKKGSFTKRAGSGPNEPETCAHDLEVPFRWCIGLCQNFGSIIPEFHL